MKIKSSFLKKPKYFHFQAQVPSCLQDILHSWNAGKSETAVTVKKYTEGKKKKKKLRRKPPKPA